MSAARQFRVEMSEGQGQRLIDADVMRIENDWLIFYRKPSTGGTEEYWRAALRCVVSIETKARGEA